MVYSWLGWKSHLGFRAGSSMLRKRRNKVKGAWALMSMELAYIDGLPKPSLETEINFHLLNYVFSDATETNPH